MIPSFLIFFREILEIAVILGVVLAATRGVVGRNRAVWLGILGGVFGAGLVAFCAEAISDAMDGMGQELFNGVILLVAAAMIGWTTVWMQTHGRELSKRIKQVGAALRDGEASLYSVTVMVALCMWREGAEIVLFMTGIGTVTTDSLWAIIAGSLAGGISAAMVGGLIYFGLLQLSSRHFFRVTGLLLVLLAAGLSAAGAGYLTAADILPALHPQLWDSSWLISEDSLLGQVLHAMMGYTARPSGMELIFYLGTLGAILVMIRLRDRGAIIGRGAMAMMPVLALGMLLSFTQPAEAAFTVYAPRVEEGVVEIENKNRVDFDHRAGEDRFRQHVLAVGYGLTDWWAIELEGEWEKDAGHGYGFHATELEQTFQLTDQGEYWVDVGARVGYERSNERSGADKLEGKLLLEKSFGAISHRLNLGVEQQVGSHRDETAEGDLAYRLAVPVSPLASPSFEYYGDFGEIQDMPDYAQQKHRLGLVLYGQLGAIQYELGWLFGISKAAEDHVLKLHLEYEFAL